MQRSTNLIRAALLFVALFLVFTPFESPGSFISVLVPRFAIIAAILLLAPTLIMEPFRSLRPAFLLLAAVLIHLTILSPTNMFQLVAEWVGLLACVIFARFANRDSGELTLAIRALLVVNVIALVVQILASGAGGELLDIHRMIFPMSESRVGVRSFAGKVRYGGLHLEPGTYSTWVAVLIVMSRLLVGRFRIIEWVAALSMLLTYSVAGVLYACLFAVWTAMDAIGSRNARAVSMVAIVMALGAFAYSSLGIDRYLEARFTERAQSSDVDWRKETLRIYGELPILDKIAGYGHTRELCEECHMDDLGFGPNMIMRGGILAALGVVALFWMMIRLLGVKSALMTIIVVATAKAATNTMGPWVVLLVAGEIAIARMVTKMARRRRAEQASAQLG